MIFGINIDIHISDLVIRTVLAGLWTVCVMGFGILVGSDRDRPDILAYRAAMTFMTTLLGVAVYLAVHDPSKKVGSNPRSAVVAPTPRAAPK